MSAQFVGSEPFDSETYDRQIALKNARLGLVLWRIANGLIFAFFVFAQLLMRQAQPSWPPPGVARLDVAVPLIISVVLGISWFTGGRALAAMRRGDKPVARGLAAVTMALGAAFFVGLVVASLQVPASGAYSSIVLAMNGFHAVHTLIGLVLFVWALGKLGGYTKEKHWGFEGVAVFWQFVVLMWVFFFLTIYIV